MILVIYQPLGKPLQVFTAPSLAAAAQQLSARDSVYVFPKISDGELHVFRVSGAKPVDPAKLLAAIGLARAHPKPSGTHLRSKAEDAA